MFIANAVVFASTVAAAILPLVSRTPPAQHMTTSLGFRLIVNVTGPDFPVRPVNGHQMDGAHTGAGLNRATVGPNPGLVFYQNGTDSEAAMWQLQLLADLNTAPFKSSIAVIVEWEGAGGPTGAQFDVDMNAAPPSKGLQMSPATTPTSFVDINGASPPGTVGTFAICRQEIPILGRGLLFDTVDFVTTREMPDGCVAVNLVPECDVLRDVSTKSFVSHKFAREVRCYPDVQAIKWTDH